MADRLPMTPQEYVERLTDLVRTGREVEALQLAAQCDRQMAPHLSLEQIEAVSSLLAGAELMLDFAQPSTAPAAQQPRTSESVE